MMRIEGQSAPVGSDKYWRDPHNAGNYTLIANPNGFPSTWEFSRITGDLKYTDLINFDVSVYNNAQCKIEACSESQVFSIGDYGTNFCNMHDLYCTEAGCNPFTKLLYDESVGKCTDAELAVCVAA